MSAIPPPEKLDALIKILWYVVEKELTEEQRERIKKQISQLGISNDKTNNKPKK